MAKLGEGDPRWIVREREDGKNVNSWHWTEKDISEWSKETLNKLLENQQMVKTPRLELSSKSVSSSEMDGTVFNRKGKLSFILDGNMTVNWEGKIFDTNGNEEDTASGKFILPEVDHETEPDSMQIDLTTTTDCPELEKAMQTLGRTFVRGQVKQFFTQVKNQHMVQDKPACVTVNPTTQNSPKQELKADTGLGKVVQVIEWQAPAKEVFEALTDQPRIAAYTRAQAVYEKREGGNFSFLNGAITGTITKLVEPSTIHLKWRADNWPNDKFSSVQLVLDPISQGVTSLRMTQTDVPANDLERTKIGWQQNFWEPIKMLFGYQYNWKEGRP